MWLLAGLLAFIAAELALIGRDISATAAALKDLHHLQARHLAELERIRALLPESRIVP